MKKLAIALIASLALSSFAFAEETAAEAGKEVKAEAPAAEHGAEKAEKKTEKHAKKAKKAHHGHKKAEGEEHKAE